MQLRTALLLVAVATPALAEDRVDSTVTWFSERRPDGGALQVLHPQLDLGVDLGSVVTLGAGYQADVVSGATPTIYSADAVTSASQMSDVRHSGHAGLGFTGARSSLDLGYTYSTERDYRSHAISAGGTVDLAGKNTTFALSYTRNFDHVCDFNNGDAEPLSRRPLSGEDACFGSDMRTVSLKVDIDTVQASLTQNLTPTLVLQLGVFGQVVRGFQANPYRRVRVYDVNAQESVPEVRDRGAAFLRMNLAIPAAHAAASLFARGYSDSWGIDSGSVELDYHQYLGSHVLVRLRGRGYQQTGAVFFRDAVDYARVGPVGRYFTGDREHAPLRTVLAGGKLSYLVTTQEGRPVLGLFDDVDIHVNAEGLWTMPLTDTPPGGDVEGPVPDAIIIDLGILLRY